jgi:hypothetical protein
MKNGMKNNNARFLQRCIAPVFLSAGLLMFGAAADAATISILGSAPPVPGPDDQSQTNMPSAASQPPGLNYYFDNGNAPSQTFITGNNPNGYTLSSLAIYDAGNSGGGFSTPQTFTLYIYSVSGNSATLLTSYTSQSVALPDNQWFSWSDLGAILQPNTQYAWSMHRNGSGWANAGNVPGDLYPAGQVASIPTGGGNLILSSDPGYDATFDVGLTAITAVSAVAPGTPVTAWAAVNGPGPYTFQWRTDGGSGGALTNIPSGTSSNLVINTTGFTDGFYQYALVVSNNSSSATGQVRVLQIQSPIGIPGVIGVKFAFAAGYATTDHLSPADNTGVATGQIVPPSNLPLTVVGNWNNLFADVPTAGSQAAAINQTWTIDHDSTGTPLTGVTLTPFGFNDGWYSGGTGCAAGRLLYDCWKINASGADPQFNGSGRLYGTLTFNNLPWGKYDVIVYVNNNNGNYWGNMQANSVVAQGGTDVNNSDHGFNGASADPCALATPLHTFGSYNGGNPANSCNYVRIPNVATESGGVITIQVVSFGGGSMGVSGVELVPVSTLNLIQDITPNYVESVPGQPLVLSVSFSNTPPVAFEWTRVSGGNTNTVTTGITTTTNNEVVTSSLAFGSLQLSDTGSYWTKVSNAGNLSEYTFSSSAAVLVSDYPAAVNNIVLHQEAQVGVNYYPPTWAIDSGSDLIYGLPLGDGSAGTALPGLGDFGLDLSSGNPAVLTDGQLGVARILSVSGGPNGAGNSVTYGLQTNASPLGFEITNIVVYAGWVDGGRRDQAYEVLYSTVWDPATFVSMFTTHYLPDDPTGQSIASCTRLLPINGVLAHNVHSIKINWEVAQFLNGYSFYDEIEVNGTNSTVIFTPVAPVISSASAAGTNLVVTGSGGTPYASYTWLVTTNLEPPVIWTPAGQGALTGAGALSNSLPIDSAESQKFFRLRMP